MNESSSDIPLKDVSENKGTGVSKGNEGASLCEGAQTVKTEVPDEVRQAIPAEVGELDLYQKREKIYTRQIEGFFQRIRLFTGWPLLLGYFLMPWLMWDGHQAILFDLPERKFYILFLTFWPQDFPLLAWLLIIAAFALFTVTNLAGRVWCGYTCPQTVWTAVYMWMEQKVEGSRNQRRKLDQSPISTEKLIKKTIKHGMFLGFAFLTGFTFIAYFVPAYELFGDFFTGQASLTAFAWVTFFTLATYINAAKMREQVCMYMCPYARFQSAMFDQDTLIVSYDAARGEPRGSRKRNSDVSDIIGLNLGDCIDCKICVQVCPTGIDIRNGLQYECIGCALCVDACDSVMEKMNYPKGLIRYTTEHILKGGKTNIFRPRLVGYFLVLIVMMGLFTAQLFTRQQLELDVIRDRQQLFTRSNTGLIENTYTLKMINKTDDSQWFDLEVIGLNNPIFSTDDRFWIEAGTVLEVPIRLAVNQLDLKRQVSPIEFQLHSEQDEGLVDRQDSRFIGPDRGGL